jgi:arabinofuranosyltransferase
MIFNKKNQKQDILCKIIPFVFVLFFLNQLWGFYHDDAYIVLKYVQNFLDGNGLVWNIGERVEGYSTFLWVVLIGMLGYCGIDLVIASRALGILFALATILLFFNSKKVGYPWGALLLSTNSCFALWALGGLETIAFSFFVLLGCLFFLKKNQNLKNSFLVGVIFSLAAMTRPEGILFFALTGLFFFYNTKGFFIVNIKRLTFYVLGFLALYLPYFVWRYSYYGYLFPCTFYVKGGTNIFKLLFGTRYLGNFLMSYGFPLLTILFIKDKRNFFKQNLYLITLLCVFGGYVLFVGGDHMAGFRFFVPVLPLFYLFIKDCFYAFRFKGTAVPTIAVAILLVAVNFYVSFSMIPRGPEATLRAVQVHLQYRVCQKVPDAAAYMGKHIGSYMKEHWPKDSIVAVNAAGAGPYYSRMNSIDMLGLNNYVIAKRKIDLDASFLLKDPANIFKLFFPKGRAELSQQIRQRYSFWQLLPGHGKGDGKYVLSQKPDYIILGGAEGDSKPWFIGDQEIFESLDFKNNYELKIERIQINDDFHKFYKQSKTGILEFKYYMRKQQ